MSNVHGQDSSKRGPDQINPPLTERHLNSSGVVIRHGGGADRIESMHANVRARQASMAQRKHLALRQRRADESPVAAVIAKEAVCDDEGRLGMSEFPATP
jgi:hypothetical protein